MSQQKFAQKNGKKVVVIGAGPSGLAASCYLARDGFEVTVVEKNAEAGGRARKWEKDGFCFDMGPSWYWMPEVFEQFFADFGHQVSDYYELIRLDPAYRIFTGEEGRKDLGEEDDDFQKKGQKPETYVDLPADYEDIKELFEKLEPGSLESLEKLMQQAAFTYQKGLGDYMQRPSHNLWEFVDLEFIIGVLQAGILQSYGKQIREHFQHPQLRQILEFPVLFLGATAEKTPYLYSLMAYAQLRGGTWYPVGGMWKIIEAMTLLATELGVQFLTSTEVTGLKIKNDRVSGLHLRKTDS